MFLSASGAELYIFRQLMFFFDLFVHFLEIILRSQLNKISFSKMTQLVDFNLQSEHLFTPPQGKFYDHLSRHSTAANIIEYTGPLVKQSFLTFIYETENLEFDLMFEIKQTHNHTIIRIYLLLRNGQIFKLDNQIDRIFLIKSWLGLRGLYAPCIDPLTGFVYFRIGFFDGEKKIQSNIHGLMNKISLERVYKSVQKLSEVGLMMEGEKLVENICNQEKSYLQISKLVGKLIESNDLQTIFAKKSQNLSESQERSSMTSPTISQLSHILEPKLHLQQHLSYQKISSFLTSLSQQQTTLTQLVKRKAGRSNYDSLLINQSSTNRFQQLINTMLSSNTRQETFKTAQADLGKITLVLQRHDQQIYQKKTNFLRALPKQMEYHFLDKYFRTGLNIPILVKLSLKQENLSNFLQSNKMTMSLQTRLRLMLQVYSAVTTLWEENKIVIFVNSLENIFVTKNLSVKLRGIEKFYKPDHHVLLEEKELVNLKIAENLVNLAGLYFKILFNHALLYVKPSNFGNGEITLMDHFRNTERFQKLIHPSIVSYGHVGKGLRQFLLGLGYIFGEHVNIAKKIIEEQERKMQIKRKQISKVDGNSDPIDEEKEKRINLVNEEGNQKLLNYKYTCCWLMKVLEALGKEKN